MRVQAQGQKRRTLGLCLAGAIVFWMAPALTASPVPAPEEEKTEAKDSKKKEESQGDEAAAEKKAAPAAPKKPRVITNADLAKYAKKSSAAPRVARTGSPASPVLATPDQPAAPGPGVRIRLPGDDLDSATLPELETMRDELASLLRYLEVKFAWFRNPLLPAPDPPHGEEFLDPELSAAQDRELTRTRILSVRGRLQKAEALLASRGGNPCRFPRACRLEA